MEWDINKIRKILMKCGSIALKHYEQSNYKLKADMTLVTEADIEIENYLSGLFDKPDKGLFLIGEETLAVKSEDYINSAFSGKTFIVDPIDGTAPYSQHIPIWGISIGLMEKGVLTEGAIYLPLTGEMFVSNGSNVYFCQYQPFSFKGGIFRKHESVSPPHEKSGIISITQDIAKNGELNAPNCVHALCCSVFSSVYVFLGRYMAFVGTAKLWDLAGCIPIALKCGYKMELLGGEPVTDKVTNKIWNLSSGSLQCWFLKEKFVLAATSNLLAYVKKAIVKEG